MKTKYIILLLFLLCNISNSVCNSKRVYFPIDSTFTTDIISIQSGASFLFLLKTKTGNFYPKITSKQTSAIYFQDTPAKCEIITKDSSYWIAASYSTAKIEDKQIVCTASLSTEAGSEINLIDIYKSLDNNLFEVIRSVKIQEAKPEDLGFSTRYTLKSKVEQSISDYDFLVPSVWYKDNTYVGKGALASDYSNNDFWFREDRLPLPVMMVRDKISGSTFSIVHKDPNGSTFKEERGLGRIIDKRMQFASIGLQNNKHPEIGITYPGSEGEISYLGQNGWAHRNHPMKKNFEQEYKIAFQLTIEENYSTAIKNTWNTYYNLFSPQIYSCDIDLIYSQQINVLNKYWKSINNAAGVPFRILLDGTIESESDYNFNMGFVGHQPGNASLLIREGLKRNNKDLLSKGEQMANFWADNCVSESGCPKTWYDPYPQTWRGPEVALREIGDGMLGLLRAWNYERIYNHDKKEWLAACIKVADWIVARQLADGSFYSHYNYNTGKHTKTYTNCTSHIIPYLVEMYMATGKENYKKAALNAGNFIHNDVMLDFKYVGGAIDNPNVMDKEAASMALRAFLALYDVDNNTKWMDAVMQTVYFYQTWVVSWNIPIPKDDKEALFPANRSVVGQSIIATGHSAADTYAAIDAFGFYRAYLYSGDKQLLHFSNLLLKNTKQFMNWNLNDPIPWIAKGLFGEAMNVSVPRGRGVNYYLPWATYNQLEPLVLFYDTFGYMQIDDIETLPKAEKENIHKNYSLNRLYKTKTDKE